MSVHIRYRFLKEKGDYLKRKELTRGYTLCEGSVQYPFHKVLREFYKDFKGRPIQVFNIWRSAPGEANYRMEEEERLSWI